MPKNTNLRNRENHERFQAENRARRHALKRWQTRPVETPNRGAESLARCRQQHGHDKLIAKIGVRHQLARNKIFYHDKSRKYQSARTLGKGNQGPYTERTCISSDSPDAKICRTCAIKEAPKRGDKGINKPAYFPMTHHTRFTDKQTCTQHGEYL